MIGAGLPRHAVGTPLPPPSTTHFDRIAGLRALAESNPVSVASSLDPFAFWGPPSPRDKACFHNLSDPRIFVPSETGRH